MRDFWSRRRAAVAAEAEAEAAEARDRQADASRRDRDLAERPEAEILAELGLPDPDAMRPGDDFAAFLRDEVPGWLRRRALRRLWRSNPVLACQDGLVDYAEDYTDAGVRVGAVATTYRVGEGLARHVRALAEAVEAAAEPEAAVVEADAVADAPEAVAAPAAVASDAARPAEAEAPAPAARRMRFRFEEASA